MDKKPKILSIDDNDTNQKLLLKVLAEDFDVTTAMSGCSGIEALSTLNPDAILLDIDMPYLDGLKICRMIRAEPSFATTPILFVSGMVSQEDQLRGFQAGGDDYITKPIDISQLKEKILFNLHRNGATELGNDASNDTPALEQDIQTLHDCLIALINTPSFDQLAFLLLETLERMKLKGAFLLHRQGKIHSSIGPLSDLESLLLNQATHPYPAEYSARFIWGGKQLGAIIQNMPLAKSTKYRPLVQILSTLFTAINEKLEGLTLQNAAKPVKAKITQVLDRNAMHTHGYKLEYALEQLEHQSELNLSQISHQLQEWINQPARDDLERQRMRQLFDRCTRTRVTIYDQCLEVQTQHNYIMACVSTKEEHV